MTGDNGHYKGSINLYLQGGTTAGQCDPKVGVAQITIVVAPNGASAQVTTAGKDCDDCSRNLEPGGCLDVAITDRSSRVAPLLRLLTNSKEL